MIIDGSVSQIVRNSAIDDWEWAHSNFEALKAWKSDVFDKKVRNEFQKQILKNKLITDTK